MPRQHPRPARLQPGKPGYLRELDAEHERIDVFHVPAERFERGNSLQINGNLLRIAIGRSLVQNVDFQSREMRRRLHW